MLLIGAAVVALAIGGLMLVPLPESHTAEGMAAANREEFRARLRETNYKSSPLFVCAAGNITQRSRDTLIKIYIDRDGTRSSRAALTAASDEALRAFERCGVPPELVALDDTYLMGLATASLEHNDRR